MYTHTAVVFSKYPTRSVSVGPLPSITVDVRLSAVQPPYIVFPQSTRGVCDGKPVHLLAHRHYSVCVVCSHYTLLTNTTRERHEEMLRLQWTTIHKGV